MTDLFDPGLQPERTMLAWHRTLLALAAASALAIRLMADEFGTEAAILCVAGVGLAMAGQFGAARRYERSYRSLMTSGPLTSNGLRVAPTVTMALAIAIAAGAYLVSTTIPDGERGGRSSLVADR